MTCAVRGASTPSGVRHRAPARWFVVVLAAGSLACGSTSHSTSTEIVAWGRDDGVGAVCARVDWFSSEFYGMSRVDAAIRCALETPGGWVEADQAPTISLVAPDGPGGTSFREPLRLERIFGTVPGAVIVELPSEVGEPVARSQIVTSGPAQPMSVESLEDPVDRVGQVEARATVVHVDGSRSLAVVGDEPGTGWYVIDTYGEALARPANPIRSATPWEFVARSDRDPIVSLVSRAGGGAGPRAFVELSREGARLCGVDEELLCLARSDAGDLVAVSLVEGPDASRDLRLVHGHPCDRPRPAGESIPAVALEESLCAPAESAPFMLAVASIAGENRSVSIVAVRNANGGMIERTATLLSPMRLRAAVVTSLGVTVFLDAGWFVGNNSNAVHWIRWSMGSEGELELVESQGNLFER